MRPDILTMQAFGPYAGRETIDFNSLGERTMFVISGKTGAGKQRYLMALVLQYMEKPVVKIEAGKIYEVSLPKMIF